jgi:hypothetical protein
MKSIYSPPTAYRRLPLKSRRSGRIDDFRLTISDFINLQSAAYSAEGGQ